MSENKRSTREQRLKQRFAVRNEGKLYHILQLIFAAAQIVAAYVTVWESNFQLSGIVIFALLGALLLIMTLSSWKSSGMRAFGRGFSAVVLAFFLVFIITDTVTTGVTEPTGNAAVARSLGDYIGQFTAYACLYIQAILLAFYPAYIIAVRREELHADIVITRVISWATLVLSIATFTLSFEDVTRLKFSNTFLNVIPTTVLLVAYCIFGIASVIAVMMAHPYGINGIKAKMDALKNKNQKNV